MLKIPFALEPLSGELVDVGQVKSGRDCGCRCPSCGQSVIARQGDINQWHFAHDSKASVPPHSMCEISFYVCCKRFVTECIVSNEYLLLALPSYHVTEKRHSFSTKGLSALVTDSKKIHVDVYSDDGDFDLVAKIGGHRIDIVLGYPERHLPKFVEFTNATLLIDLRFVAERYETTHTTPTLLLEAVRELFDEDITHKRWVFHPREIAMRARLRERLETEFPEFETNDADTPPPQERKEPQPVSCKMCKREWVWITGEPLICEACNTHMYVVLNS